MPIVDAPQPTARKIPMITEAGTETVIPVLTSRFCTEDIILGTVLDGRFLVNHIGEDINDVSLSVENGIVDGKETLKIRVEIIEGQDSKFFNVLALPRGVNLRGIDTYTSSRFKARVCTVFDLNPTDKTIQPIYQVFAALDYI